MTDKCSCVAPSREGRPLLRPRRRWEDNIKTDRKDIGWKNAGWNDLAEGRDNWWVVPKAIVVSLHVP